MYIHSFIHANLFARWQHRAVGGRARLVLLGVTWTDLLAIYDSKHCMWLSQCDYISNRCVQQIDRFRFNIIIARQHADVCWRVILL